MLMWSMFVEDEERREGRWPLYGSQDRGLANLLEICGLIARQVWRGMKHSHPAQLEGKV